MTLLLDILRWLLFIAIVFVGSGLLAWGLLPTDTIRLAAGGVGALLIFIVTVVFIIVINS
jgi:hypothetical protein